MYLHNPIKNWSAILGIKSILHDSSATKKKKKRIITNTTYLFYMDYLNWNTCTLYLAVYLTLWEQFSVPTSIFTEFLGFSVDSLLPGHSDDPRKNLHSLFYLFLVSSLEELKLVIYTPLNVSFTSQIFDLWYILWILFSSLLQTSFKMLFSPWHLTTLNAGI